MAPEESPPTDPMDDAEGAESLSMEEINSLLAKEDPRFVEGLKDIGELKAPEGMKIELLGIEEEGGTQAAPTSSLWARLRKLLREPKSLGAPLKNALHGLVRSSIQRKNKVKAYFKALSPVARRSLWLMFFCLAALAGSLASLGRLDLRSFLGQVEIRDLREVASETFYFDQTGPRESFFSPMRRPDSYILLKSMVVQLRPTSRHPLSKVFLEFIVDASSQRAALEVQNTERILRDKLARAIEGFSYDELRTPTGKARLKETLTDQLNASLSTGYARNIYFQKFLLH